jgi:hypothetical protein
MPFFGPCDLAPAGVPADNATFFCDYGRVRCYSHSFRQSGHQGAEQDCVALGGELVQYRDAGEQQLVEQVGSCMWGLGAALQQGCAALMQLLLLVHRIMHAGAGACTHMRHACSIPWHQL